jgi:DNA repair protein RecO (recombination protein O)
LLTVIVLRHYVVFKKVREPQKGAVFVYSDICRNIKPPAVIVKTRAVILREIKYRDQSKICSIYTREFGKMSVIIKGARNPKNRLSGLFSAGNVVDLVLYKKSSRDIQLVSDGNLVLSPMVPEPDLERFAILYRIIDFVRHTTQNDEKNLPLFTLLAGTLEQLYHSNVNFQQLYAWFLLRFVSVLGFQPSLRTCVFSGEELLPAVKALNLTELYFVMNPGGLALPAAAGASMAKKQLIPVRLAMLMRALAATRLPSGDSIKADPIEIETLWNLLQEYCSLHLEHARGRKNLNIVSQILLK